MHRIYADIEVAAPVPAVIREDLDDGLGDAVRIVLIAQVVALAEVVIVVIVPEVDVHRGAESVDRKELRIHESAAADLTVHITLEVIERELYIELVNVTENAGKD